MCCVTDVVGKQLKYVCKTGKKLTMQRCFVKKRTDEEQHGGLLSSTAPASQVAADSNGASKEDDSEICDMDTLEPNTRTRDDHNSIPIPDSTH